MSRTRLIHKAVAWLDRHGVAVGLVVGVLALAPWLVTAFGFTRGTGSLVRSADGPELEALRNQLVLATASGADATQSLQKLQDEVTRLRAELDQAAKDLADEVQSGQQREDALRSDLATVQHLAESRTEMARGLSVPAATTNPDAPETSVTEPTPTSPSSAPPAAVAPFDIAHARKHQKDWASQLGIDIELTNSLGQTFVVIPPGRFTTREGAHDRDVTVTQPFLLGIHEVTNAEWKRVMGEMPASRFKDDGYPITGISFEQAQAFCDTLSALPEEQEGGRSYRMPTTSEWEHACRAGTTTAYYHGDDISDLRDYAWFNPYRDLPSQKRFESRGGPAPVGLKRPNAWGLYDMHGNAREWTVVMGSAELHTPSTEPPESQTISSGGSWAEPAHKCASYSPSTSPVRSPLVGLRLVLIPR